MITFSTRDWGIVTAKLTTYVEGGVPAMELWDEQGAYVGLLSTYLPGVELGSNEFTIKNWTENSRIAEDALASGHFEDTGRRIPTGFVQAPIWKVVTHIVAHRYGLQFRPCSIGAQPRGFIPDPTLVPPYGQPDWQNPEKRFGCLDYPERLSEQDVKAFELHYFGPVWRALP